MRRTTFAIIAMALLGGCAAEGAASPSEATGSSDLRLDCLLPGLLCAGGGSGSDGGTADGGTDGGADVCDDGVCGPTESARECAADCGPAAIVVDGRPEENVRQPREDLDSYVRSEMDAQALVGLGVGVVRDGAIVYLKGYGEQDAAASVPALSYRTMFRWASVAKTLTGIVGLKQHSAGELDLDRPIESYYGDYTCPSTYLDDSGVERTIAPSDRLVTTRQLLGHLGGIQHYTNGLRNPSPSRADANDPATNTGIQWAVEIFQDWPLVSVPGERYNYSSFGMNLAGVVIENAAGAPFASLVDEHIAIPAGLTTLQPDYEWADIPHRAVGYDASGADVGSSDVSWKQPGGGFISTVEDLALYCGALMGDAILSSAEKDVAWRPQQDASGADTRYGVGFQLGYRNGRTYVQHSGAQQKTRTRLRYYNDDGLCIVVMSNSEQADTYGLVRGIEDVVRQW